MGLPGFSLYAEGVLVFRANLGALHSRLGFGARIVVPEGTATTCVVVVGLLSKTGTSWDVLDDVPLGCLRKGGSAQSADEEFSGFWQRVLN